MSFKILVMSCDKNKDLFKPFYLCMEKYWKDHPEIIYCTETIDNPYYKTKKRITILASGLKGLEKLSKKLIAIT